ncbi:heme ABC exporter ATP-binding protein CcmA [Chloroflexota bacterium]
MELSGSASQAWAIETQGLTKSFGHRLALRDIDLQVRPGETVVIFGPNGAGKTTLIKVLATIMNPSSGSVFVDGLPIKNNAEEIRRKIGVVTHQTFLYSNLTAYENLEFYSRMYDVPRAKERIHEVLAMVGMNPRLYERVGTLSRGMQQRLSLARALLHNPAIMLLDEPETGLDQQAISMLRQSLQTERGEKRTTILTTHNLERGFELCDCLLILAKGKIVYQESTKTLDLAGLKQVYQQYTGLDHEILA